MELKLIYYYLIFVCVWCILPSWTSDLVYKCYKICKYNYLYVMAKVNYFLQCKSIIVFIANFAYYRFISLTFYFYFTPSILLLINIKTNRSKYIIIFLLPLLYFDSRDSSLFIWTCTELWVNIALYNAFSRIFGWYIYILHSISISYFE